MTIVLGHVIAKVDQRRQSAVRREEVPAEDAAQHRRGAQRPQPVDGVGYKPDRLEMIIVQSPVIGGDPDADSCP